MELAKELREREEATYENVDSLHQKFSEEYLSAAQKADLTPQDYDEMSNLLFKNEDILMPHVPDKSVLRNSNLNVYYAPDKWKERIAEEVYHAVLRYFQEQISKALDFEEKRIFHVRVHPKGFELVRTELPGDSSTERQKLHKYLPS